MTEMEDQEQLERLKAFWIDYGRIILWVALVVCVGAFSWVFYSNHRENKVMDSSSVYVSLQQSVVKNDTSAVSTDLNKMKNDYASTEFAVIAHLDAAKFYFDRKEYDAAAEALLWAKDHTKDKAEKAMTLLRLSTVYLQAGKLDEALSVLNVKDFPDAFLAAFYEQKGDVYFAKAMKDDASQAYSDAMDALGANSGNNSTPSPLLQLKLDSVN